MHPLLTLRTDCPWCGGRMVVRIEVDEEHYAYACASCSALRDVLDTFGRLYSVHAGDVVWS